MKARYDPVLDGPTGKRLAPGLPALVAALRRHAEVDIDDATAALGVLDVGGNDRPATGR